MLQPALVDVSNQHVSRSPEVGAKSPIMQAATSQGAQQQVGSSTLHYDGIICSVAAVQYAGWRPFAIDNTSVFSGPPSTL